MTTSYNNLGIGGFLDLLFGQVDSLTKTYVLPATGASFVVETNLERYNGVLGGLSADPIDNWDSYSLVSQNGIGAVSSTGSTAGGGTQTWGLQYGSLQIVNVEAPPLTGGLLENDRVRFELNTGPGSAWDLLAPGSTLTQTITIRANEAGGFLILPDLDGDIGSSTDTFTFTLSFKKDNLPPNQVVDGTEAGQEMFLGYVDAQGDQIDGTDGLNDIIYGNGGDDTIDAWEGNDTVYGGAGNDRFQGSGGDDTVYGGDGNDYNLSGDAGNDVLYGDAGNDVFGGDIGNDTLDGGTGNDVLEGHMGADVAFGGNGDDYIVGGDVVNISDAASRTLNPTIANEDNAADVLSGGAGNDTILGNGGNDSLHGGDGNDIIIGGDTTVAGSGVTLATIDPINMSAGNLRAGSETYTNANAVTGSQAIFDNVTTLDDGTAVSARLIVTHISNPSLRVDLSYATSDANGILLNAENNGAMNGQTASFRIEFFRTDNGQSVTINPAIVFGDLDSGTGNEQLIINSGLINAGTLGGSGINLSYNAGSLSATGTADASNYNTAQTQVATVFGPTSSVDFTLVSRGVNSGFTLNGADPTSFTYVQPFIGNPIDNDVIDGGLGDDTIYGGFGADAVIANDGNDLVYGGAGNDQLFGGAGHDSLYYNEGSDIVYGGAGNDLIDDIGGISPTSGSNLVYAEAGNDLIWDGAGNDTVYGGADNDSIFGDNTGNDIYDGGAGRDSIFGGLGSDTLIGGQDNDTLDGATGDDDLIVGAGDAAYGGSGDDVFTVDPALTGNAPITIVGGETVEDLSDPSNGGAGDVLDLRGLTNVVVTPTGPEAGTASYTNGAGQTVTITYSEIETILQDAAPPAGAVDGTAGNDTMGAGFVDPQGDQIDGTDGVNDTIYGGAGNDTVDGGVGNDTVDGGVGADTVTGGAGNDSVLGGDGSDTLAGGAGNDELFGGAGDDDIAVGNDDVSYGGGGDDVFTLDGTDPSTAIGALVVGGSDGTNTDPAGLENGNVGDKLDLSGATQNLTVVLTPNPGAGTVNGLDGDFLPDVVFQEIEIIATGSGNDTVDGATAVDPFQLETGAGNDSVTTGSGTDQIFAGIGNDTVDSGAGNDYVDAGDRNDTVSLGAGTDTAIMGTGNDTADGGAGDDILAGGAGSDSLSGGDGNDTVLGSVGEDNDTLLGGAGDDSIAGEGGADSIEGGDGNDILNAGTGNDIIYGGAGNDTVDGGDGDDFINTRTTAGTGTPNIGLTIPGNPAASYTADATPNDDRDSVIGGLGNDTILTGDDNDTIFGGTGNDSIDAGFDDDSVDGGTGNDTIAGNEGRDTLYGGDGDDKIYGALSPDDPNYAASQVYELLDVGGADPSTINSTDLLYGGNGNDFISGDDDADTLYGGADNDTLDGGIDNDSLFGDAGRDSLIGGQGNDTLSGDVGSDTLVGGEGNDVMDGGADDDDFVIGAGDTATGGAGDDVFSISPNTLTGTSPLTVVGGETDEGGLDTANGSLGDVLDLSGGTNVTITYNQLDPTWNGLTSESGTATYRNAANQDVTVNFSEIERVVVCFAAGTMIDTAEGEKAIESLQVGDLVRTADHDYQPIRWIGSSKVAATGSVAPILIKAGALGNTRDLRVSPQHRMLLGGWQAEMLFGDDEVLVAAKHLVNDSTILRVEGGEVEYFHMLFDTHEIVFAEGAPSESFHPGEIGWGALAEEAREEILMLFPELRSGDFSAYGTSARRTLKAGEAKVVGEMVAK